MAAVLLLAGCGGGDDSEPAAADAANGGDGFCAIAEDYLALQRESDALNQSAGGGTPDALRGFWTSARDQAADLQNVAPEAIADDVDTIARVVTEYDAALAGIDYDIERLITDEDPAQIDRFREIDLQASAEAGLRLEEYYAGACGELPEQELELEPVEPLEPPA